MIFVIEGPDGSGKTTLANALAEALHVKVRHSGPPKTTNAVREYGEQLLDLFTDPDYRLAGHVVFDRFHVGERIYGPRLRDHDGVGEVGESTINHMLRAMGGMVIFCFTDRKRMLDTWRTRNAAGKELVTRERDISDIMDEYEEWWARTDAPGFRFDYTRQSMADVIRNCTTDQRSRRNA